MGARWVINKYNEQLHVLNDTGHFEPTRELKDHYRLDRSVSNSEGLLVLWFDEKNGKLWVLSLDDKLRQTKSRWVDLWSVMPEPEHWESHP